MGEGLGCGVSYLRRFVASAGGGPMDMPPNANGIARSALRQIPFQVDLDAAVAVALAVGDETRIGFAEAARSEALARNAAIRESRLHGDRPLVAQRLVHLVAAGLAKMAQPLSRVVRRLHLVGHELHP